MWIISAVFLSIHLNCGSQSRVKFPYPRGHGGAFYNCKHWFGLSRRLEEVIEEAAFLHTQRHIPLGCESPMRVNNVPSLIPLLLPSLRPVMNNLWSNLRAFRSTDAYARNCNFLSIQERFPWKLKKLFLCLLNAPHETSLEACFISSAASDGEEAELSPQNQIPTSIPLSKCN